jgi:hypothetical protein
MTQTLFCCECGRTEKREEVGDTDTKTWIEGLHRIVARQGWQIVNAESHLPVPFGEHGSYLCPDCIMVPGPIGISVQTFRIEESRVVEAGPRIRLGTRTTVLS